MQGSGGTVALNGSPRQRTTCPFSRAGEPVPLSRERSRERDCEAPPRRPRAARLLGEVDRPRSAVAVDEEEERVRRGRIS